MLSRWRHNPGRSGKGTLNACAAYWLGRTALTGGRQPVSLIGNERTKLTANALDRFSTVCLTVGVAAPLGSWFYGGVAISVSRFLAGGIAWICAAVILHPVARALLRMLKA
jgi:hypothetical protein